MPEQKIPVNEIMSSKDIPDQLSLSSVYELEDVLSSLKEIDKKVQFLKEYKKNRAAIIDAEIKAYEDKNEWLRNLALTTMSTLAPKEKTLSFPGIGKITRRTVKGGWDIIDERSMLAFLEDIGVKDDVVETRVVIDKKKVKPILDNFSKQRSDIPGVVKKKDYESVTITHEEKEFPKQNAGNDKTLDDLDSLEL
jgi:hypothetical protein